MFKTYLALTKPGIIRGNLLNATAGFLLAANGVIDWWLLLAALGGTALIVASGCVYNNYIDRGIDRRMARTRARALATGSVSAPAALAFATLLGTAGFIVLAVWTNWLTVWLGIAGLFLYVVAYAIAKRRTVYGTIVGSVPGALPPVAGYAAVSGAIDVPAALIFLIVVCWQMPHFYAIAIYRRKEYAAAGLPVLPIVRGIRAAKIESIIYAAAFAAAALLLAAIGTTGVAYAVIVGVVCGAWLGFALRGLRATDDVAWARRMFHCSLAAIAIVDVMLMANAWLP